MLYAWILSTKDKLGMAELNKMEEAITSWSLNEGQGNVKDHKTYCLRIGQMLGSGTANPPRFRVLSQTCLEAYLVPAQ